MRKREPQPRPKDKYEWKKLKHNTFSWAAQIEAGHDSGGVDSLGLGQERDGDSKRTQVDENRKLLKQEHLARCRGK
jgi:hypothetical protein